MTVEETWKEYMGENLPKNCSRIRREETKKAFYAGAKSMLSHFLDGELNVEDIELFIKELDIYIDSLKEELS